MTFGELNMKTEQTPADILQTMRDDVAYLDARINGAKSMLVSHGWVVTSHGLPLAFDTDEAHRITGVHVMGWRGRYSRLTREDAERLAPTVKDGRGEASGKACPLVVALEHSRAQVVAALSWAEDAIARRG